jgi:glycosyltransferase involved in cell wall biosynthesis
MGAGRADGAIFASVITPTRARPELLLRALRSLQAQEDPSWEAIVVDDGDGEGAQAARALGDRRIRPCRNAGAGPADARLTALARARGEILCWLDDDDWWDDTGHLALLRAQLGEREFGFRGGWIVHEDASGRAGEREVFDLDATAQSLRIDNTILTSSIAYPREAHRELGLLDRELGGYCDWDFMLRLCDAGYQPHKLPGLGVCYAVHPASLSAQADNPTRRRSFERFASKHALAIRLSNHVEIHRLHGAA